MTGLIQAKDELPKVSTKLCGFLGRSSHSVLIRVSSLLAKVSRKPSTFRFQPARIIIGERSPGRMWKGGEFCDPRRTRRRSSLLASEWVVEVSARPLSRTNFLDEQTGQSL